jgi:peptidoglycan/LPS O-acetylase OafA/YrhL
VWVGVVSYGIYLWHWPLLVGMQHVYQRGSALGVVTGFVITPVVAAASYYCLERPVRTIVRRRLTRSNPILSEVNTPRIDTTPADPNEAATIHHDFPDKQ